MLYIWRTIVDKKALASLKKLSKNGHALVEIMAKYLIILDESIAEEATGKPAKAAAVKKAPVAKKVAAKAPAAKLAAVKKPAAKKSIAKKPAVKAKEKAAAKPAAPKVKAPISNPVVKVEGTAAPAQAKIVKRGRPAKAKK